jgi:hypothetical protein
MVRQTPDTRRWIRTSASSAQAANPPATETAPLTTRCRRSWIEIDRGWNVDRTVKFDALLPVPAGVVTLILPVTAPTGTVAVIWVAELTAKLVAPTPPNRTAVAPVKLVPVIVTTVPARPLVGVNDVIVGATPVTVKFVALVAVPPGVVTVIRPVVAPDGTFVSIRVPGEFTVNEVTRTPLNRTWVAPPNPRPLILTEAPIGPLVGENDVIEGAVVTVKFVALVAVPPAAVTVILPVTAPLGTVAMICVPGGFTENVLAATPPNFTEVTPVKFDPKIVTDVPTGPLAGENELMVGAGDVVTMKSVALVAVPPGVVTVIFPVTAPLGTVAVICVPEELTENVAAETPPNLTDVAPVKPVPLITTTVPTCPLGGEKDVIAGVTLKSVALVAVPPGVATLIFPVTAPVGTVAMI